MIGSSPAYDPKTPTLGRPSRIGPIHTLRRSRPLVSATGSSTIAQPPAVGPVIHDAGSIPLSCAWSGVRSARLLPVVSHRSVASTSVSNRSESACCSICSAVTLAYGASVAGVARYSVTPPASVVATQHDDASACQAFALTSLSTTAIVLTP